MTRKVQLFSSVSAGRVGENRKREDDINHTTIDDFANLNIDELDIGLAPKLAFPILHEAKIRQEFGDYFVDNIPPGYTLSRFLGKGGFGQTFSACKTNFDCIAVKVINLKHGKSELQNEYEMQKKFHAIGLAPNVIGTPKFYTFKGEQFGIIVMEQIDGVLDKLLKENLYDSTLDEIIVSFLDIVRKLKGAGYSHRDAHPGNISFNYQKTANGALNVKLNLIDFGHSQTNNGAWPEVEVAQFLRTLSMTDEGVDQGVTERNQEYIFPRLLAFFQTNFNPDVTTQEDIEDEFDYWFDESG